MHSQVSNSPAKQQPTSAEVLPFPVEALKADRPTISRYASALFRNCTELQGWVSLRAFDHVTDKCVSSQWTRFGKGMVDAYEAAATTTANHSSLAVFAPPACIFLTNENAKAANIAAGPAIVVEIDERPQEASASLEIILGPPTMVIASGGTWTAPDGSAHDKRHLYWRLKKPATTPDALAKLTRARKLATALASADPTNNPINHPIRCPGSWHTKTGAPRLCEIIGGDEGTEIDLDDALVKLERVAGGLLTDRQNSSGSADRDGFKTPREWTEQSLLEVAERLPNKDRTWDDWNKIGMAIYDASHASEAGREAFHAFSEKSEKYDGFLTDERWDHYGTYPPSDLSGGTLTFRMREIDADWEPVCEELCPEHWLEDLSDEPGQSRDISSKKKKLPGELISFQELASTDLSTRTSPLIKGLLGQGAFSVLYGESNTGKTFVAMDMAFHISCGMRWAGLKTVQVPVLFVAAEGNQGATFRVKALQSKYSREAFGARFHLLLSSIDLLKPNEHLEPLVEAINEIGAKFVVLDTLSRVLAGGDENSSVDMGALVRNIDLLRKNTGAHIMAVHHTGKNRERGARGHSLLRAAIDTEIEIADNSITVTKQRDMDKSFGSSFMLEPVMLGADEDGDPVTSCTIRLVSENDLPPGTLTETERKIVDAISALEDEQGRKGLKVEDIADYLSDDDGPIKKEAIRTRVRELSRKRVVERAGRGLWRLKAVEKPSTALCEGGANVGQTECNAVENGQAGQNGVFE